MYYVQHLGTLRVKEDIQTRAKNHVGDIYSDLGKNLLFSLKYD